MELEAKYVFILNAIVALFFGLSFMFTPIMIMEMVGPALTIGVAGEVLGVHYGIMLVAVAILMILLRNQPHSDFRQSVFLSFIVLWTATVIYQVYMISAFGFGNPMWMVTIGIGILWIVLWVYQYYTNMSS
ncbi:MAG: hypothetical protein ACTSV9_06175 [Candidatus Thorarchaeota archaeon]